MLELVTLRVTRPLAAPLKRWTAVVSLPGTRDIRSLCAALLARSMHCHVGFDGAFLPTTTPPKKKLESQLQLQATVPNIHDTDDSNRHVASTLALAKQPQPPEHFPP